MTGQLRVMIVHGSEDAADLIRSVLSRAGLDVASVTLSSRREVAAGLDDLRWDLILAEQGAGPVDASAVLHMLGERNMDTPLIVMPRRMNPESAVAMMLAGAFDYVPMEHVGLLPTAVERAFEMAKARTGRRRAEDALRRQIVLYETFLQAQSDLGEGVFILDGPAIAYANEAFADILGYPWQEITGIPSFPDLAIPEDREALVEALRSGLTGDGPVTGLEATLVRKGGGLVNLEFSVKAVDVDGRSQLLGIARDVTDTRRAEAELAAARHRALAAEKLSALGALATGVTHEINTPLTFMGTNVTVARKELETLLHRDDLPEDARAGLQRLFRQAESMRRGLDRIGRVSASLEQLSAASGGRHSVVDVNGLVESVLTVAQPRLDPGVLIQRDLMARTPLVFSEGDLVQVLVSLVLGAERAMEGAKAGTLTVRTRDGGLGLVIEVTATAPPGTAAAAWAPPPAGGPSLTASRRVVEAAGGLLTVLEGAGEITYRVELPIDHLRTPDAEATERVRR